MASKIIGRVGIKLIPDATDFRDEAAKDLRKIEKQLKDVEVDVIPDIDKGAKTRIQNELKAWSKTLDFDVKVGLDLNNADMAKTTGALSALTKRRKVMIAPEIDNGALARVGVGLAALSGLRYTQGLFRKFREEIMQIDLAVPKIGMVSHAVSVLGAWIMGVSGNLFSLSSSIASMGKAGLALPGLLGGIAIGLGATVAALVDFNKQVPQAVSALKTLQNIISTNFWEVAAGPIRELVDQLFPILNVKLAEVSVALGGFFAALANSTTSILLPSLPPMFDHLTQSIEIATGFTDAFVGIIEKLGKVGSAYLPSLATWFGDISTQFDNWLGNLGTDGLTAMIDEGIVAMQQFGSVTASIFSIAASLGRAAEAAGGSTLESLSEGLRETAKAAKDPAFQAGLTATLTSVYDMLTQIGTIAGPAAKGFVVAMSENFQRISPIIGDTVGTALDAIFKMLSSPAVADGLEAMFSGFNDLVHALAPVMDLVGDKIGVMGKLVGTLASNLGPVMAAAIVTLKPVFISLVEALLPVIEMLGPIMTQIITALGPVFKTLGDALGRAAEAAKPMFAEVQKLVDLLLPILVPVLKIVASIIGGAIIGVINGLTLAFKGIVKVVEGVIQVFQGVWDVISGLFSRDMGQVLDGLKGIFGGLGNILLGALQAALGAVWAYLNGTVLGFFRGFGLKLLGPFKGPLAKIFEPIIKGAKTLFSKVKPLWDKLVGIFSSGKDVLFSWKDVFTAIKEVFGTVFKAIMLTITTVLAYITGAWDVAWNGISIAVEFVWNLIWTAIKTYLNLVLGIITAVWNVISTVISTVLNAILAVVTWVWDNITGGIQIALDLINAVITTVIGGIATFLEETWTWIKETTTAVWEGITSFFSTAWETIKLVFTTVLDSIKEFLEQRWENLKNNTEAIWDAIKGFFTTTWDAIKAVFTTVLDAVKSFLQSRWDNMKRNTEAIWDAVKGFFTKIWDGIKSVFTKVVDSIKSFLQTRWDNIKSNISAVWDSIKSILSKAWDKIKTAVTDGIKKVVDEVKSLKSKATNALSGIATTLYNAGKDLIQGFIDGVKNMFGKVKTTLTDLTKKLTDWKGPAEKDRILLKPAGRMIMQSLLDGFESKFSAVRTMLTDLTSEIAGFIGKSMSQEISDALSFAMSGEVATSIRAEANVAGVDLERRLSSLEGQITSSARAKSNESSSPEATSISIGNVMISLEDLAQLKDLEEFFELLRIRVQQG